MLLKQRACTQACASCPAPWITPILVDCPSLSLPPQLLMFYAYPPGVPQLHILLADLSAAARANLSFNPGLPFHLVFMLPFKVICSAAYISAKSNVCRQALSSDWIIGQLKSSLQN